MGVWRIMKRTIQFKEILRDKESFIIITSHPDSIGNNATIDMWKS